MLLDGGAHVDVGDLRHGEAHQRIGQRGHRHIHPHHPGRAAGVPETQHGYQQSHQRHQHGAVGAQARQQRLCRAPAQRGCHPHGGQQHIAQRGQHQQRREQAHTQQAHPGQPVGQRALGHAVRQQAHGQQQSRGQQHWRQPGRPGRIQRRQQAPGHQAVQQQGKGVEDGKGHAVQSGRAGARDCLSWGWSGPLQSSQVGSLVGICFRQRSAVRCCSSAQVHYSRRGPAHQWQHQQKRGEGHYPRQRPGAQPHPH